MTPPNTHDVCVARRVVGYTRRCAATLRLRRPRVDRWRQDHRARSRRRLWSTRGRARSSCTITAPPTIDAWTGKIIVHDHGAANDRRVDGRPVHPTTGADI